MQVQLPTAQKPVSAKPARQPSARVRGGKTKAASGRPGKGKGYNSDSDSGSGSSGSGSSSSGSSESENEPEEEEEESDEEFKGKTPPPTKKATGRKKKVVKIGGNASHWAVPYDPVLVPMASKTLEKILAWRNNNGVEELLIKHKVCCDRFSLFFSMGGRPVITNVYFHGGQLLVLELSTC